MLTSLSQRARAAIVVIATALAAVPVIGTMASDSSSVTVTTYEGNLKCADLGYAVELKLDRQPVIGTEVFSVGAFSVTLTNVDTDDGQVLSWSSASHPVELVLAKGAPGGNAYAYSPAATGGSGLHTILAGTSGNWAAFSHLSFCFRSTPGSTSSTVVTSSSSTEAPPVTVLPPLVPLTIDVAAAGSYTKTFDWRIAKTPDVTWRARSGASAPLGYVVTATQTGFDLSDQELDGTVTINNPNPGPVTITSVAVSGASCQVQHPTSVASGTTVLDVSCNIGAVEVESQLPASLGASIGWDDPSPIDTVSSAATTAVVGYDVTTVNETVTVSDAVDGGSGRTLGTASAPATSFRDDVVVPTPAVEGCRTVGNVATIAETGQSANASVTLCRQALTRGGFTIGFWQNKNGQAKITAALCSSLATYGSAWAGTGFPTGSACTTTSLQAWVTSVFKNANSKDHVLMLRAQTMATALNVLTDSGSHLGETDVPVGGSCRTVSALLSSTSATWTSLVADRAGALTIKDIFDRINNNTQAVCA